MTEQKATEKHTPGPWQAEHCEHDTHVVDYDLMADGKVVARLDKCSEANARLMAAAPKLLEALKRIKGGFDDEDADAPSANGYWPLWTRVAHDGLPSVRDEISAAIAEVEAQP